MSTLASEALGISVTGDITSGGTTLVPTVTRVETRIDVNPVSVILAVSVVFVLAPITISSNTIILAAFYRYKRLRTASNCLLASLAVSDFGVGVFMPFGMHLELSGLPENAEISTVCIAPYCIVIALCSVSVLVSVAIAVDRLTSLAQPLRYKNIITHSSVEKYIAVFWLYSIGVGLSPLIYAHIMGLPQSHSGSCRFNAAIRPPVQVFLVLAVWAPSALVLLGCYMYVYLVARAHARAIYTVELSFRHQTQTMALPRYGQTLAVTVGAFLVLWLPFQACMLLDIFCGTKILTEWAVVWLGLPILSHSAANPWIYAFHHGEMRVAASKIAEDVVTRFGIHPSRYGCSPIRRGSNTNFELAEMNKSHETRPPPVEDCFAAKQHPTTFHQRETRTRPKLGEIAGSEIDISPEGVEPSRRYSIGSLSGDVVEEDIRDLTKMLSPEYAIDRNHLIDSNHNIDRIKHLKYILDPTFNRLKNLKCLSNRRACQKTATHRRRSDEPKFISYQNLKSEDESGTNVGRLNTMSDPILHPENAGEETRRATEDRESTDDTSSMRRQRNSNLSSMSDPNLKITQGNAMAIAVARAHGSRDRGRDNNHGCSVPSLRCDAAGTRQQQQQQQQTLQCRRIHDLKRSFDHTCAIATMRNFELDETTQDARASLNGCVDVFKMAERQSATLKYANRQVTLTTNRLASLSAGLDDRRARNGTRILPISSRTGKARLRQDLLTHSASISAIERTCCHGRNSHERSSRFVDSLVVPAIHSEPSSPVEPLPLDSVEEGQPLTIRSRTDGNTSLGSATGNPQVVGTAPRRRHAREILPRSPSRPSNPVLLDFEDPHDTMNANVIRTPATASGSPSGIVDLVCRAVAAPSCALLPEKLAAALLLSSTEKSRERRPSGTIFAEHDSTRFSSRRPSDLRWSESSRSQEILSTTVNDRQGKSPSSYSVNNVESCASGSDLNDVTCLGSFVCPNALTSSLRESFFEPPSSVTNSEVFTSLEDLENSTANASSIVVDEARTARFPSATPIAHCSVSSVNLERSRHGGKPRGNDDHNGQSKSSESVMKNYHRAILRLEAAVHRSRRRVGSGKDCAMQDSVVVANSRLAPLAVPTPMDICTPTYETATEIKGTSGVGVRV